MQSVPQGRSAIQSLDERLREIEQQRNARIAAGEDRAHVDREAAEEGLGRIILALEYLGVETSPVIGIIADINAISSGSTPSAMLTPLPADRRRPDSPSIENFKGRLAAIMEHYQRCGLTRKEAAVRVVRHTPSDLLRKLSLKSPATVDSWLLKWGGERGANIGDGRKGYEETRYILLTNNAPESKLPDALKSLDLILPG